MLRSSGSANVQKRTVRGSGSISRRKDGYFEARISAGFGPDGRRIRFAVVRKTIEELNAALATLRQDIEQGAVVTGASRKGTVSELIEAYLQDVRDNKKATTYDDYRRIADNHVLPILGDRQRSRLTAKILDDHVKLMLVKVGVGSRTRRKVFFLLRAAFDYGRPLKLVGQNLMADLKPPAYEAKTMKTLSEAQAKKLLSAAKGQRYEALYLLLLLGGLRSGEAFALQRDDIDLKKRQVHIRRTVENIRKPRLSEPKTKASTRVISIDPYVAEALRKHLQENDQDTVFTDRDGGLIRRQNFTRREWYPLLDAARLPRIRMHDLRHTSASIDLANGTPAKVVQERLGHSSIRTTLDTYAHTVPGMGRQAADRLATILVKPVTRRSQ